jgi:predicted HAD superfamily phosphohydrolase
MGGAFGVVGSGAGMAWKSTIGDEAKWLNKYDSNANISAREQKSNALEAEAIAARQTEDLINENKQAESQKINQEQSQQIAEQEQAKAQYDNMSLEDKLKAQPEANIKTVPRQDANGNIIPDRQNEPSIFNNMKNDSDMEDEISKLPPEQQQAARDYLEKRSMQDESNRDARVGSKGKDYQENSVNDLINAKKAMEDLDHQDNIASKLEELGYPKDSKTFRDKLATDEFPTESYSDYMKRKTFDRKYSNLEQQDALEKALSEDKINPIDDVKGNFTTKDDLLEKFKKADDNNEASLSSDFKDVFKLAGEMEHKKKMLQEKGVSSAEAEKIIKTYHGDDKYFKDAQAIRDSLNKEPMNFNNPIPKSVKDAKTIPSEDMQKLNELSKNPYFNEHLKNVEKSGVDAVDSSKGKNIDDSKTTNSDSGFKTTPKDVFAIKKALQDGKIDKATSEALDRLSNDLELKTKDHAPEYENKAKNELNKDENKQTIGDRTLDILRKSALNKIRNADAITGEGQKQIDDAIKELGDIKSERDKIIVKDWVNKVGSGEEVNKLIDSLDISEKLNKICGE